MPFHVGFPGLPPSVYLRKCVSFFRLALSLLMRQIQNTNYVHFILYRFDTLQCECVCFLPHENSYSIKHITRSIQANSIYYILEYDTCILENWLRIDDKKRYKQQYWNCEMSNKCQLDKQTNKNEASKSGKIWNETKWKHNLQHQTEKEQ